MALIRNCARCEGALPPNTRGPRRIFCGKRCAQGAWKDRNRERLNAERRLEPAETARRREERRRDRDPIKVISQRLRAGMRVRAAKRGLPFDAETITPLWVEVALRANPNCGCCGTAFVLTRIPGRKGPSPNSPSIDRIVPSRGYVVENVAFLCWRCNNLKRDASPSELERVAAWMRSHGDYAGDESLGTAEMPEAAA